MRRPFTKLGLAIFTINLCTNIWAQNLEFNSCQIRHDAVELDAECALLSRAENPDQPDGKHIGLFVAKLPSTSPNPEPDAFTLIQGGPGGSSIDMTIGFRQFVDMIRSKRDVLILDQRGTGRSNFLQCDIDEEYSGVTEFDEALTRQHTLACTDKLKASDLRYYTTSIAVQDLDALRKAAGYQQLTLYGVSYGTRVAQHYLRRFPDYTRAIVIDGVVDVEMSLAGAEIARRSQAAFDNMINRCKDTPDCNDNFGDVATKFKELRQQLKQAPVELSIAHPNTGAEQKHTVSEADLLAAVRLMPYSTEGLSLLPMLISHAHSGNYLPLAAHSVSTNESFVKGFATGMHNSVVCAEDAPFVEADAAARSADTYFGTMMIDVMRTTCENWPQGPIDSDFKDAFDSKKPVLILSGETDPITPPANGERAAKMFSNSKHIQVPAHGHGVIGRGCVPYLVKQFIETADLLTLNTDCVERERSMPFFVDTTGPTP